MQVKLNELTAGQPFFIGEHKFIVIRQDGAETFVTTADTIREQCFDNNDDNSGNVNDFSGSQLKEWLNNEYLETLAQDLNPDDIVGHAFTLEDDRGGAGYGSCTCKVGLISMKEYEQHKDILKLPRWWWLRTPDAANSCSARIVLTDGSLHHFNAYHGSIGVRPALYLKSDILVFEKIDLGASLAEIRTFTPEEIKPAQTAEHIKILIQHCNSLMMYLSKINDDTDIDEYKDLSKELRETVESIHIMQTSEVEKSNKAK